jgi:hypothetical protein
MILNLLRPRVTVVFFLAMTALDASAQTPFITDCPPLVAAGPDYATDVLANAWDFSDQLDLSPFPEEFAGWTISGNLARTIGRSAFLSGGKFVGQTQGSPLIPLLYRGGVGVDSLTENTGFFDHKAIPTARYGKISVSVTLNRSTPSGQLVAFWSSGPYNAAQGQGAAFSNPTEGTHIYTVDLLTGEWYDTRGNAIRQPFVPAGNLPPIAWNGAGLMRGFQLRPTSDASVSVGVEADWVRITQRDGAPGSAMLPITFSGCPARPYNIEVFAGGNSWDIIYAATAANANTETAVVNYGVLPPGSWQFRVACYEYTREGIQSPQYSAPVTIVINDPPVASVFSPDAIGDSDFATDVLHNPWDWNAISDAQLLLNIGNPTISSDGVTNALQGIGASNGDPAVFLLYGNGQIDTSRYRLLTFAETLDTPFGLNGALGQGSLARVLWGTPSGVTVTRDILMWPGRNVYTIDLASLTLANGGIDPSCAGCPPWQATPLVPGFRIDPHESRLGVSFRLGAVSLRAFDEVRLGSSFTVQYTFSDPDVGTYQARIYIDTDRDPTVKTQLATISSGVAPNTALAYSFDPAALGVVPGAYYIYVEIVETRSGITDTRGTYSSGPIVVSSGAGPVPPGAPTLSAVQTTVNPVTVSWTPGAGSAPTNYAICAGISPGGSQFGCFNMGLATSISANVPAGIVIYARMVASNAFGSAVSNEISFILGGGLPGPPTMNAPIVSGRTVSLSWNPPPYGGAPTSYIIIGRFVGSPTVIATFELAGNGAAIPNVPPGDYVATVVARNGAGVSPESNAVIVSVR